MKVTKQVKKILKELGKIGGDARAKKLTPAERKTIAQKASKARWSNHKKKSGN